MESTSALSCTPDANISELTCHINSYIVQKELKLILLRLTKGIWGLLLRMLTSLKIGNLVLCCL